MKLTVTSPGGGRLGIETDLGAAGRGPCAAAFDLDLESADSIIVASGIPAPS